MSPSDRRLSFPGGPRTNESAYVMIIDRLANASSGKFTIASYTFTTHSCR